MQILKTLANKWDSRSRCTTLLIRLTRVIAGNVATFSNLGDSTKPAEDLDTGDDAVTFRLSFFDRENGNVNPDTSSTGEHRLDNVQLTATAATVAAVPEPSGLCLLLGGFGLLSLRRRR